MKLSLVIPCYNEAANLPVLLPRCADLAMAGDVEIVLVDNGSTDDTPRVLTELLANYPACRGVRVEENRGYGSGILAGLRVARGDILGWTHADMQTDPLDAKRGLALFERHGKDIFVKGRRYGRPYGDVVFMIGMSAFETLLLGRLLWDINAQPTLFSRAFFESWCDAPHDFSLDLFAYYQARLLKLPVYRFPVRFGDRAHGVSHWNVSMAAKWRFIRRTVDYSMQMRKTVKR